MKRAFNSQFKSTRGIRRDVAVAFGLVLLVFFVFIGYLFPGIFSFEFQNSRQIVLFFAVVILALGAVVVFKMVEAFVKIRPGTKRVAEGGLSREEPECSPLELSELGTALNRMSYRIKQNMEELKIFSEKTEQVNKEINRRIMVLTSLLQISSLMSQNADLDKIIDLSIERCLVSGEMDLGCLVLKEGNIFKIRSWHGERAKGLKENIPENIDVLLGQSLLAQIVLKKEPLIIDGKSPSSANVQQFRELFKIRNAVIIPILIRGQVYGVLIIGNDKDPYECPPEEREILMLLAQQISLALENEFMATRLDKLEIRDSLTGLFNRVYVCDRLEEEIKRAIRFQRPCSFALLSIDHFERYHGDFGRIASENALLKISSVLKDNISEVDKAARFDDHEFAIILPEKNKRQCIEVTDEIRQKIEFIFSTESDQRRRLTCTGAVTENPIDGINAEELISKAKEILKEAVHQGGNKICYKI